MTEEKILKILREVHGAGANAGKNALWGNWKSPEKYLQDTAKRILNICKAGD